MMSREEILESGLIEQYVLGLMNPDEIAELESYFERFPDLIEYRQAIEQTMEKIAFDNAIEPPPDVKAKIMNEINTLSGITTQFDIKTTKNSNRWLTPLLAVGALTAILFGYLYFDMLSSYHNLKSDYSTLFANCEEANRIIEKQEAHMAFINNPNTQAVILSGTALSPNSSMLVHWNKVEQIASMNFSNLPPAPAGKTYQLWADIDGEMVDMGILNFENNDMPQIPFMANATSLNVTLEKAGGADHPDVSQLFVNGLII